MGSPANNRSAGTPATAAVAGAGAGGGVDKGVDFINYFCMYAFLSHQKEMLSDRVRMDAYYKAVKCHLRGKKSLWNNLHPSQIIGTPALRSRLSGFAWWFDVHFRGSMQNGY